MTMIYCEGVKRGYEQTRAKGLAHALFDELELPTSLPLTISGMLSERCAAIQSEELHAAQKALYDRFLENGWV